MAGFKDNPGTESYPFRSRSTACTCRHQDTDSVV